MRKPWDPISEMQAANRALKREMMRDLEDMSRRELMKRGIKLAVALAVLVVVLLGRRKPEDQQKPYWAAAGVLTLVNVAVAVFVSFL